MRTLIILASLVYVNMASAVDLFHESLHRCIIEKAIDQYPQFQIDKFNPRLAGVLAFDESNIEIVFLTTLEDGSFDRFFVSLKNGDLKNASLTFVGLSPRNLNIELCF